MSCVRSNERQGIGFLNDYRRLNVALTRAKYGLVVVGNMHVLSHHHIWHELIKHLRAHRLIVDGRVLDTLKENTEPLSRPRPPEEKYRVRTAQLLAAIAVPTPVAPQTQRVGEQRLAPGQFPAIGAQIAA